MPPPAEPSLRWLRVLAVAATLAALLGLAGCESTVAPPGPSAIALPTPPPGGAPRNAFVLLSGGGTPLSNHYSQYLQARAMTDFFARRGPPGATWVFFGVGNRTDAPAKLADAHRVTERDGLKLESWLPGTLRGNRPATRESFLTALRTEILPVVRDGGTLFLFVGDHGELTKGDTGESAITMWQLKPGGRGGNGWSTDDKEVLAVSELRRVLAEGLGRGRVVFCMTQCHSGGFHFLGVPREVTPPREWFTSVPDWARARQTEPLLPIAGFTATDEESIAAGCVADPNPERWTGYERFAPEALLGVDLLSEKNIGPARASLAAAHEAATLTDRTIDKPRASSEQFLERWASLIETRLAKETRATEKTRRAVAGFTRAVETGAVGAADRALQERQEQFQLFTARLVEQNPATSTLLVSGTRKQLEDAAKGGGGGGGGQRGGRKGGRGSQAESRKAWNDTLRPAWKAAVMTDNATMIPPPAVAFEKHLLRLEEGGKDFLLARGDGLLNEIYWNSSYARPQSFDPVKAEAVVRWAAERRARIVAWGQASGDIAVKMAAEKIGVGPRSAANTEATAGPAPISRRTAAERVLFYRRVLAAWEFLLAMDDRAALTRLQELIELERTPLPAT
ncbi:MAG TPA: hypothetical protein VM029_11165 [Opitutaceae bacterium]|nr:hypothetical protein [Opitutaceae bacterium]